MNITHETHAMKVSFPPMWTETITQWGLWQLQDILHNLTRHSAQFTTSDPTQECNLGISCTANKNQECLSTTTICTTYHPLAHWAFSVHIGSREVRLNPMTCKLDFWETQLFHSLHFLTIFLSGRRCK